MAPTGDPPYYYNESRIPPGEGIYGPQKTISSPNSLPSFASPLIDSSYKIEVSFERELIEQLAKQVAEEIDKEILNGLKTKLEPDIIKTAKEKMADKKLKASWSPETTRDLNNFYKNHTEKLNRPMPPVMSTGYTINSGSIIQSNYGSTPIAVSNNFNIETLKEVIRTELEEERKKQEAIRLTENANNKLQIEAAIKKLLDAQNVKEKEERSFIVAREVAKLEKQVEQIEDIAINNALNKINNDEMNKKLFASYKKRTGGDNKLQNSSPEVLSSHNSTATIATNTLTYKKADCADNFCKVNTMEEEDDFDSDLEEEEMEEEKGIVQTLKDDSKLVAKRVAARKVVNVARDLLVSMLSAGKTKKEANNIKNTVGLMLQTDDGKAVLSFMLGAMLPLILAQLPEKYHNIAKDMAQEFRVEGMAHFGTMLTDFVTGPAFQGAKSLITSALDEAMDDKETKSTGVRVATDMKNESTPKKEIEEEAVSTKTNNKRNNHSHQTD